MASYRHVLPEDIQQLLDIVQKGKLFALQQWISGGKRIRPPADADYEFDALIESISTGFHSMIEELLRAGGWSAEQLAAALESAQHRKRFDITELLEQYGAQPKQLDFQTCCEELDLRTMERHLRSGTDPNKDNDFARALSHVRARPLLAFYKKFHTEFPALQDQAALALSEAVQKNQVRWTALLAWAGADPFRHVPSDLDTPFPPDPDNYTTAASEAVRCHNSEILKALHLKPNAKQALELLTTVAYHHDFQLLATLLAAIPRDQINLPESGSCEALERLVWRSPPDSRWSDINPEKVVAENLKCIELLLDAGAKWNPTTEEINSHRRYVIKHDAKYIVQLVRLLLYTPNSASPENVLELCRSQTMLSQINAEDPFLAGELKALKKEIIAPNACDATANKERAQAVAESPHIPS